MDAKPEKRRRLEKIHFEKGLYQHYKGDLYLALMLADNHEMVDPETVCVVYYSFDLNKNNIRPFEDPRFDSWNDEVLIDSKWIPRFQHLSFDDLIKKRLIIKYGPAIIDKMLNMMRVP
jgi:hypothetical protein